ncbi:MAG: ankyrin repeat domain-containing protein [Chlamydiota bacterium]|jgi:ankyrin repeat protein
MTNAVSPDPVAPPIFDASNDQIVHQGERISSAALKKIQQTASDLKVKLLSKRFTQKTLEEIQNNTEEAIFRIRSERFNPKYISKDDRTLSEAVSRGDIAIVRELFLKGSNLIVDHFNNNNALCDAILGENLEMVKLLVEHGVAITPHHLYIVNIRNLEMVKLLVELGAKINTQFNGESLVQRALRVAFVHEGYETFEEALAEYDGYDYDGYEYDGYEIVWYLLSLDGIELSVLSTEETTYLFFRVLKSEPEECENIAVKLVEAGIDVNAIYGSATPLREACQKGYIRLIRKILSYHDININAHEPIYGLTAIHAAVFSKSLEVVKLLMAHGADINIKDWSNETPLAGALGSFHLKKEVALYLTSLPNLNLNLLTKADKMELLRFIIDDESFDFAVTSDLISSWANPGVTVADKIEPNLKEFAIDLIQAIIFRKKNEMPIYLFFYCYFNVSDGDKKELQAKIIDKLDPICANLMAIQKCLELIESIKIERMLASDQALTKLQRYEIIKKEIQKLLVANSNNLNTLDEMDELPSDLNNLVKEYSVSFFDI